MAAGSISLRINRCSRACGHFRAGFKALVLLGMCGGIYYVSQLPQVENLSDKDPLTEEDFVIIMTSRSPQIKSTPEVAQLTENFDYLKTSIFNYEESLPKEVQTKENFEFNETFSSYEFESIPKEVLLGKKFELNETSTSPEVESIPKEVLLTEENFVLNETSNSPEVDFIPEVIQLSKENFDQLVTSSLEPWLVEFYAPWCPHCNKFSSEYTKIAKRLWGVVNVGKVNGAEEKSIKNLFGVKRFPSFLFFHGNKTSPILYKGPRTEDSIVEMVLELVP